MSIASVGLHRGNNSASKDAWPRIQETLTVVRAPMTGAAHQGAGKWFSPRPNRPVVDYVGRLLEGLDDELGQGSLRQDTRRQVLEFLNDVTGASSTFPSMTPEDDSTAILHWVAGDLHLVIDVDESGPIYLWVRTGHESHSVTNPTTIRTLSRSVLSRMAQAASATRPGWRRLIATS